MTRFLLILAVFLPGCRTIEIVKSDGTRITATSFLTQPEISEASFSDKSMTLKGYKSHDSEIVGAAVEAAVKAAKP